MRGTVCETLRVGNCTEIILLRKNIYRLLHGFIQKSEPKFRKTTCFRKTDTSETIETSVVLSSSIFIAFFSSYSIYEDLPSHLVPPIQRFPHLLQGFQAGSISPIWLILEICPFRIATVLSCSLVRVPRYKLPIARCHCHDGNGF